MVQELSTGGNPGGTTAAGASAAESRGLSTAIAVGMVLAAILGALIAWRAAVRSDAAADLFDLAAQQLAQREQVLADAELRVDHDIRLARQYGDHVRAQTNFRRQANRADSADVETLLARRAEEEQTLARTLSAHFLVEFPTINNGGRVTYNRERATRIYIAGSSVADVRPEETSARGKDERSIVVRLVGIAWLSVGALFLLTLGQLLRGRVTRWFLAGSGAGVFVVAGVLFAAVELAP